MRLFIALALPAGVKDELENWKKPLAGRYSDLKWTATENFHVTLRFLGSADPDTVIAEMEEFNLERFLPASFALNRAGTFGRPPSVLWLGGRFSAGVLEAASLLGGIPDEKGATDAKRFIPHITVARARPGHTVPEVPFKMNLEGNAAGICLFSSVLTPSGPVYSSLFSVGS